MTYRITRLLALVAIVLAAAGVVGTPAFAHAGLKSSNPKDDSTVKDSISTIELVFTEDINPRYTTVVVTGPGGAKVADGKPQVKGDTVTQELKADLANGRYALAFRVISSDGHPVSEELHFTLKVPEPTPTTEDTAGASPEQSVSTPPTSAEPVSATPAAASSSTDEGGATIPAVLLGLGALVLVAGVVVLVAGRKRATGPDA
ncbi:hypothetical protein GCM10022419_129110 [Nonomuraea rosea]|uniref:CopC domain-containing protein n=1 Tax=Nonomuraea rosea TaxID=638574 RepID=A0ABP6ZX47_9ACTN